MFQPSPLPPLPLVRAAADDTWSRLGPHGGCATAPKRTNATGGQNMASKQWQIEGKYIEYCSCDLGCPCESMADPTYGHCTGLVAFKIENGYCEDLRLDGLAVVGTFYFPRAIHHGQGVFQPILDERADEAQRNALFYILS